MPEELQTPEQGTEEQEPVTPAPEATEEPAAPEALAADEAEQPSTEEPSEPASPESQPEPQAEPYKDKFVQSAREAMLLVERNKAANARIEQLTKQDTPTDEAMKQLYPEWDELNEITKRALIKTEAAEMRARRIEAQQAEILDRQKLSDELEAVMEKPEFSKLSGKEAEFKRFAMKKENRGISAEVLARAFLFDGSDEAPATPQTPQAPAAPKAEGLPAGSGGPRGPQDKKISLTEARDIRKNDYKRYMELVKSGQIEEDID